MDVISLGKANQALYKIKDLDEKIIAPFAESRFPTVDARLDWLEGQAIQIKATNSKQLDLTQGITIGTEVVDGKVQLKMVSSSGAIVHQYSTSGTWESPVIDLGDGWIKTNIVEVVKNITAPDTGLTLEVATSNNSMSFPAFTELNPAAIPDNRYIKFKATLTAVSKEAPEAELDFNQSSQQNTIALGDYTEADGLLQMKTRYSTIMIDQNAPGEGTIKTALIPKSSFKAINKIEVI